VAGAPQVAQAAEMPLVQGEDRGGAMTIGEDHVGRVGDAEVVAVVALLGYNSKRRSVIGG
jgi:hypothetical protein